MNALICCVAILAADPSPADAKLIEKAKVKLEAWRKEQAKVNDAKGKAMEAERQAAENGTVNEKLTVPFVKKNGKYVFQSDGYQAKQVKELLDQHSNFAGNIRNQSQVPPLNMASPKKGDIGRFGQGIENVYHGVMFEGVGPGPKGHAIAVVRFTLAPLGRPQVTTKASFAIADFDPSLDNAISILETKTFVVAGTIKHGGSAIPRLVSVDP